MTIYMQVDRTKYRLPIYAAESIDELSKFCGKKPYMIRDEIKKAKNRNGDCQFLEIELPDEEGVNEDD